MKEDLMNRNVLIFGSIFGVILVIHTINMVHLIYNKPNFQSNDVLGFQAEQMDQFRLLNQGPFMVALNTYMEVLPLGLVVDFGSSLILKRKSEEVTATENLPEENE